MKKFLSVILIVAFTFGMSVNSLAAEDETITQDSQDKSGKINVEYNLEESYTVTFPASVTFTDTEKTVERPLLARDVILNEGSYLNVYISSLNEYKMKKGEGYINYKISVNYNTALKENNCIIMTVNAGESSGWAILTFSTELEKNHALYAGNFTDTLTFTVSID